MVRSENGPENCIIDCEGTSSDQHRGFRFHRGENADSVLEGFTITNGYAPITAPHRVATGGAIDCINSSPTIRQCIIRSNLAGVGGGIYCGESESVISNCEISGGFDAPFGAECFYCYGRGINSRKQAFANFCYIKNQRLRNAIGNGIIRGDPISVGVF